MFRLTFLWQLVYSNMKDLNIFLDLTNILIYVLKFSLVIIRTYFYALLLLEHIFR